MLRKEIIKVDFDIYINVFLSLSRFTPIEVIDFFRRMTKETVTYRQENNVKRNDFLQLLIQLKEKAESVNNSKDKSIPWHKSKYNLKPTPFSGSYLPSFHYATLYKANQTTSRFLREMLTVTQLSKKLSYL